MIGLGTLVIVELLGGIALLLWGVRMVRTSVTRAWGVQLYAYLEDQLNSWYRAFGTGIVATAVLSSSTAMVLIVSALAGAGNINLTTALLVVLGADVGSALMSIILASGSSAAVFFSPLLLLAGYLVFSYSRQARTKSLGRLSLGLGLMLLSLSIITSATDPLRDASLFHAVLSAVAEEPLLAFLVAALLAWLFHSTLAVVLLVATFVLNGSLEAMDTLPFILGLNFGGGLPAVTATFSKGPVARRIPLANMFCRGSVSIILLVAHAPISYLVSYLSLDGIFLTLLLHFGFNFLVALIFIPLAPLVLRMMEKMSPSLNKSDDGFEGPRYLDLAALSSPNAALVNASQEVLRMCEMLARMLDMVLANIDRADPEFPREVNHIASRLSSNQRLVRDYLSRVGNDETTKQQRDSVFMLLLCANNVEYASDVLNLNVAHRINAKSQRAVKFDKKQSLCISEFVGMIHESLGLIPAVVAGSDLDAALKLAAQKDRFRARESEIIRDELAPRSSRERFQSDLLVDFILDFHRINSSISSVAYPLVSSAGLLDSTRLRSQAISVGDGGI